MIVAFFYIASFDDWYEKYCLNRTIGRRSCLHGLYVPRVNLWIGMVLLLACSQIDEAVLMILNKPCEIVV